MRKIRQLVRHLFLLPELASTFFKLKSTSATTCLFCVFPYYQTGGSERVHADILASVRDTLQREEVVIFFTKKSRNGTFKDAFALAGQCYEIDDLLRSKYRTLVIRAISRAIDRTRNSTVFGANATLLYEIIPHLKEPVRIVDLTHSFVPESDNPVERASLPCVHRLAARVVINGQTKEDYASLYRTKGIPETALDKVLVVHNRLNYPRWDLAQKDYDVPPLKVLFVGRNSPEKRVGLIARIAHALRHQPVAFTFVGPELEKSVANAERSNLSFAGEITDPAALAEIYQRHHVILIASRREGFPLVLAEGMAHGAVPVSTDVGGIRHHIRDGQNGFLVENSRDESETMSNIVARLRYLVERPEALPRLGQAAQEEAYRSFAPEAFDRTWREVLSV